MNLDRYVADLRSQLAAAAGVGDEGARTLAERLSTALDAATRLVLLEALSEAAGEITRELAPGSVDVRLRGRDAELVVSRPVPVAGVDDAPPTEAPVVGTDDDVATSRTTLRMPDPLKARVERAAAEEGLSVNSWLVRAIAAGLEPRSRRPVARETSTANRFTGWVS